MRILEGLFFPGFLGQEIWLYNTVASKALFPVDNWVKRQAGGHQSLVKVVLKPVEVFYCFLMIGYALRSSDAEGLSLDGSSALGSQGVDAGHPGSFVGFVEDDSQTLEGRSRLLELFIDCIDVVLSNLSLPDEVLKLLVDIDCPLLWLFFQLDCAELCYGIDLLDAILSESNFSCPHPFLQFGNF